MAPVLAGTGATHFFIMYKTSRQIIWRREDIEALVDDYLQTDAFSFDTETMGTRPPKQLTPKKKDTPAVDWTTNRVFWVSFATHGRSDAIACGHPTGPGPKLEDQLSPHEVFEILEPLFFSDKLKVGHNLKFDLLTVQKYYGGRYIPGPHADTGVMAHLLNENLLTIEKMSPYSLKGLAYRVFKVQYENLGKQGPEAFPFWECGRYARYDALYTWLLYWDLLPKLETQKLGGVWKLEMDVHEALIPMEQEGAALDVAEIEQLNIDLLEKLEDIERRLQDIAGQYDTPPPTFNAVYKKWEARVRKEGHDEPKWDGTFNISAGRDRGWFVYDVCGHKPSTYTEKTKEPSTSEEALRKYETKDKRVALLMEWDDIHKLHSTYVHAQRVRMSEDGRLHANFKQSGTKTGRFSCSEPNLQNIPRAGTDLGKRIRGLFVAPKDHVMVVGDFDQIELRGLAHESKDPALMRVFLEGRDPHTETARLIMGLLGKDPTKMTSEERTIYGKTPNFAMVYGAGPKKLMQSTGMTERQAREVLDALFLAYDHIRPWTNYIVSRCKKEKFVRTYSGRKRRLPEINYGGSEEADKRRGYAERQAVNTMIQGTAADVNKMAIVRFHRAIQDTPHKLILSVHDELVAYTPITEVEECKALMKEAMEGEEIQILSVPLSAEINSGARWSEAK